MRTKRFKEFSEKFLSGTPCELDEVGRIQGLKQPRRNRPPIPVFRSES
jgi:hypothetical protein